MVQYSLSLLYMKEEGSDIAELCHSEFFFSKTKGFGLMLIICMRYCIMNAADCELLNFVSKRCFC